MGRDESKRDEVDVLSSQTGFFESPEESTENASSANSQHDKELPVTAAQNGNWWSMAASIYLGTMGVAALNWPHAMASLTWVGGVITNVLAFFISFYTLYEMLEMHEMKGRRCNRYRELGRLAFGGIFEAWAAFGAFVYSYGTHAVVLECQAQIPSPSFRPALAGSIIGYLAAGFNMFSLAFAGYWAFGQSATEVIFLGTIPGPQWMLALADLLVVVSLLGDFAQLVGAVAAVPNAFIIPYGRDRNCCNIGKGGPVVGLTTDIDALPIQEQTGLPFASKGSKEEVILDEKLVGGLLRQLCLLGYRASEDQLRQGKDDVHMQGLISELCAIKKEIDYEQGYPRCPSDESNSSSKAVRTVISRQHEITSPHVRLFADCPELQAAVDADCSLVNAEAMENQQRQFQAQQQHCEAEAASLHQQAASVQCVSPQHAAASVHDLLEAAEHSQSTIGQILQPWATCVPDRFDFECILGEL
ncbi:hypothetical protein WJX84_001110 [Apatococcus fuscideae]|uniref:Amino acid transporter transmembrane domain-containing protein n=1 Tax=Apatococcus fuscideae TaxID=2026836 RepID=A0AAW1T676_9CHLO